MSASSSDNTAIGGYFIGVIPPVTFRTLSYPKQLLLMFDRLAVDLANNLSDYENRIILESKNEIDYLSEEGLLTTLSGVIANADLDFDKKNVSTSGTFLLPGSIRDPFEKWAQTTVRAYNGLQDLRSIASKLRTLDGVDAVAVGLPDTPVEIDKTAERDVVIKITLGEFPMPSDTTPWENILDFKKKERSGEQFNRLKKWMNKMGREGLKVYEVTDELKSMISSYALQMKESEIEIRHGVVEAIVTAPLEIAQNVVRLKFADVVKPFFSVKKLEMNLRRDEKMAAGREIAYIVNANKQFSS